MKKFLALVLVVASLACTMVGCVNPTPTPDPTPDPTPEFDPSAKSEGSMTFAEYYAAALDAEVVIEGYVQGKQSWWDNKANFYIQDGDGAYYAYEMACTEAEYNQLTIGTHIKVTGYKTEYHGEIEVDSGCTFEIIPGDTWVASVTDVTSLLGKDELITKQNMYVLFKGMTVKSVTYKGGEPGDDIYVAFTKDGAEYSFCVERYLTGPETDLYKAVQALNEGDVVDVEGFLYWYDGANTHITGVSAAK